jgi:hypothetical protein
MHLALLIPNVFQLAVESLARRHNWAAIIHERERAKKGEERRENQT